jgi:predicted regulator of Ras-like GTPase activity (Roadblock/LC7/MglB family)
MSFETILETIVKECGGGLGIALMGSDGIPIHQVRGEAAGENPLGGDFGAAGVEFGRIVGEIHKAADVLGAGAVDEITLRCGRFTLLFRTVDDEVILVLALAPDGNFGKARYLIRRNLVALREEF